MGTENDRDPARGERIKQLRIGQRLTQAQLAQKVGVTGRAYYEWENRGGPLSKGNLHLLADALDSTPAFLLTGEQFDADQGVTDRLTTLEGEVARLSDQLAQLAAAVEHALIRADEDADNGDPSPVRQRQTG